MPDTEPPPITEATDTAAFIDWTLQRFGHQPMVITTQFGMEGCALIDMYASHGRPLTAVYLDTMFLFPETYTLRDRMAARYPHLRFENRRSRAEASRSHDHHRQSGPGPGRAARLRRGSRRGPIEDRDRLLAETDAAILATGASEAIVLAEPLAAALHHRTRLNAPLLLIDLGMPRNAATGTGAAPGVQLIGLQDIPGITVDDPAARDAAARIIAEE